MNRVGGSFAEYQSPQRKKNWEDDAERQREIRQYKVFSFVSR